MSVVGWQISIIDGLFSQTIGHIQGMASGDQPCVGKPVQRAAGDLLPTDAVCRGKISSPALVGNVEVWVLSTLTTPALHFFHDANNAI